MNMKEPKSVISCAGFLAGGLISLGLAFHWNSLLVGYASVMHIFLGLVSAGFHWTGSYWWQKADEIGMIGFFVALFFRQIGALSPGWDIALIVVGVIITIVLGATHGRWNNDTIGLMALFNLGVLLVRGGPYQLAIAFIGYMAALYYKDKEQTSIDSRADSYHSIWHWLASAANTITTI